MTDISDELSILMVIRHVPDKSGKLCAAMFVCHCGEETAAELSIRDLKDFGDPIKDGLGPISQCELNSLVDASFPRLALNYWKSSYVRELTDEVIQCLVEQFRLCPSDMSRIIIDHFHGEAIKPSAQSTVYPNRAEGYYILIISQWQGESENQKNIEWTRQTYNALSPYMEAGVYGNYMSDDESEARVLASFGDNYSRLQKIKKKFDPANIFRGNQNITPAQSAFLTMGQGWNDDERMDFYNTSQGSQLIPYSWFLALEQSGSDVLFRDEDNFMRLGYLTARADLGPQSG